MTYFKSKLKDFDNTKNFMKFAFEGTKPEELANNIHDFFVAEGYKLERGTKEKGVYGKGNKTMRLLFGAFVKRFAFQFEVMPDAEDASITRFEFLKDSLNKISGGVIGYNQSNKEIKRLTEKIKEQTS